MADNQKLTCPICGEPTYLVYGKYPRKDGLCGPCSKKQMKKESEPMEEPKKEAAAEPAAASDLTCIICGEPSNGKHFCVKCYHEYKENGEDKTLHPDFYLPDYDIFIEYNEIKKKSYLKSKEYTKKIYDQLGFKVIIMDDQDLNSIAGCLKPKLGIN